VKLIYHSFCIFSLPRSSSRGDEITSEPRPGCCEIRSS